MNGRQYVDGSLSDDLEKTFIGVVYPHPPGKLDISGKNASLYPAISISRLRIEEGASKGR